MSATLQASNIELHNLSTSVVPRRTYIVYYITGNPGLIEYYRTFLTHLYGLLTQQTSPSRFHSVSFYVYGRSLNGFEIDGQSGRWREKGAKPPFGLQEQIARSEEALEELVHDVRQRGAEDVRVILMGHSLGAYMLLEIIRSVREKVDRNGGEGLRIVGGVCLFPAVTHLALSPNGRKSSWLFNIRPFVPLASFLAKLLIFFIPTSFLSLLIRASMSFPADAAKVTASFLRSPHGVHQALYLARDEIHQITTDAWDAEIWGSAHPSPHPHPRPILRFLFAKRDHWVADETRDDLIKARGTLAGSVEDEVEEWKPVMEIDEEEGWPHGFCIKHSVPVAERVFQYIRDIVEGDMGRQSEI